MENQNWENAPHQLNRQHGKPMEITHILFDMDGILLDTESIYTLVTSTILGRFNLEYHPSLKAQMMGKKEQDAAEFLVKKTNIPMTAEEYLNERNARQEELFGDCKVLPGVLDLVTKLKAINFPMAVATSSHKKAFFIKSQNHNHLFDMFEGRIICGDDKRVKKGKPAPDIFLEAFRLIKGEDPTKCLVFEDSPSGVKAAINAGMKVIFIPSSNIPVDADILAGCTMVLQSMEDFNPNDFGIIIDH
jgi:pseudouridine-5'-monophosphatase